MSLRVILDIFSGLPNPSWLLSASEAAELERRLLNLKPAPPSSASEPPGLGYRGFIVESNDEPRIDSPLVIYRGFVRHGSISLSDPGRTLERWLLDLAGPRLAPNVREIVVRDLAAP